MKIYKLKFGKLNRSDYTIIFRFNNWYIVKFKNISRLIHNHENPINKSSNRTFFRLGPQSIKKQRCQALDCRYTIPKNILEKLKFFTNLEKM